MPRSPLPLPEHGAFPRRLALKATLAGLGTGLSAELAGCTQATAGAGAPVPTRTWPSSRPSSAAPSPSEGTEEGGSGGAMNSPDGTTRPVDWTPTQPLPAATTSRDCAVILSPHPDDETLSLGVWVANARARGQRVVLVCLTDGRSTGATPTIAKRLGRPFDRDQVGAARIAEFHAAATALGVAPGDVVLAHQDGDATPDGTRLTAEKTQAVIRVLAERLPNATYLTMSDVAERHPDHLSAGHALRQAVAEGTVQTALFAVSRLWWTLPSPAQTTIRPSSPAVAARLRQAGAAYGVWDPAHGRYAVGWTSVHRQFLSLQSDPEDRLHH